MNKLGLGIMSSFIFCSMWMPKVQSDTAVMAQSSLVSATHKPSDDAIILTQKGILIYGLCLAECNRNDNCSAIVFSEGAGCTLYNSSMLTEPLALGEEAASITTRDQMYREDPPFVFDNLVIVTGIPGSSCSSVSTYSTFTCDKATDGDESTEAATGNLQNTNKWYQFNFPKHRIRMIHIRPRCGLNAVCGELQLEISDSIFTMTHDCSQTCIWDKFFVPGYQIEASSLRIVCTVPCKLDGGAFWGFSAVRVFAVPNI